MLRLSLGRNGECVTSAAALLIGYLLGSFSPAHFLGRRLKGIDIRQHGAHFAGTTNVYRVLGLVPAVITATYDVSKGILAMLVSAYLLRAPDMFVYLAGVSAIAGHVFPFYLGFRGGYGVGTATGLLLSFLAIFLKNGWLSWTSLALLAGFTLGFYIIFRRGDLIGVFVLPILYFFLLRSGPPLAITVSLSLVMGYIFSINLYNTYRYELIKLKPETRQAIKHLRVLMRPGAMAFPILYLYFGKRSVLILLGSLVLAFLSIDLVRLLSKRINVFLFRKGKAFFREKERHTFSSATLFLTSSFLTILLFKKEIASLAIIFLTFGDIFAKFAGLEHGKIRVFEKTLRGSLAYFVSCLIGGYLWSLVLPVPTLQIVLGSFGAAVTELLPLGVDDNFSIPLISASVMTVITIF